MNVAKITKAHPGPGYANRLQAAHPLVRREGWKIIQQVKGGIVIIPSNHTALLAFWTEISTINQYYLNLSACWTGTDPKYWRKYCPHGASN